MSKTVHLIQKVTPVWKKDKFTFKNKDLPNPLRLLIVGPSGSGKTILLLKLMIYNLDFDRLVICSPSLDSQKEYQIFIKALNSGLDLGEVEQIFMNQDRIDDVEKEIADLAASKASMSMWIPGDTASSLAMTNTDVVTVFKDPELMPSPEQLRKQFGPKDKILVIVDDCMKRNQTSVENLFVYGRPLGIQTIFLTQAFFEIDKNSIRGNCNSFIFFETSNTDLRHSFEQVGARGFSSLEDYKAYAKLAWSFDHGYFYVDLTKKTAYPGGTIDKFKMNSF